MTEEEIKRFNLCLGLRQLDNLIFLYCHDKLKKQHNQKDLDIQSEIINKQLAKCH